MYEYVHHGGKQLDSDRLSFQLHVFVGATNRLSWRARIPTEILTGETPLRFYYYEICAKGGISLKKIVMANIIKEIIIIKLYTINLIMIESHD